MAARKVARKSNGVDKRDEKPAKVPPDGGWGWFVVAAFALNFAVVIPILQNFGLIFGDVFRALKFTDTAVSILINVNYSVGVCLGLFNGPILRTFSFRQVAMFASALVFIGMALTATAANFWQFLVYYGFLMAAGSGFGMAAFSFAVNSYFKKRRGMAMGIAMTATGLGPVIMPQLIGYFSSEFGSRGTALLLSALSLHSLVGACLLQPVEWHMKPAPVENIIKEDDNEDDKEEKVEEVDTDVMLQKIANGHSQPDRRPSMVSVRSASGRTDGETGRLRAYPWWTSGTSLDTVDLGNTLRAASEKEGHCVIDADDPDVDNKEKESIPQELETLMKPDPNPPVLAAAAIAQPEKTDPETGCVRGCLRGVVRFFDLDLLRDPIYVNLMLGMSIAVFAEVNFSLLMPFILKDRDLSTKETATMMSLIATADIIFRFLAPFIGRAMKLPSRVMYTLSLCLLVASRATFVFAETYTSMLAVMLFLGMAKGVRTVFWVLVIPEYVPLERLPAASGLQSVTNGIISIVLGPLLGVIRDATGSYNPIIMVINVLTVLTVVMWTIEMIITKCRRRKKLAAQKSGL